VARVEHPRRVSRLAERFDGHAPVERADLFCRGEQERKGVLGARDVHATSLRFDADAP
jgi:hypothetical protein